MSKGLIKFTNGKELESFNIALEHLANELIKQYGPQIVRDNTAVESVFDFSNEDLDTIFNKINVDGKKVLTVGSSGDQMLCAIGKGASKVTLIDANPMSLPYTELKLAAIKNLTFNEFSKMFQLFTSISQFYPYYKKISHDLSQQSQEFWDTLFLNLDSKNELIGYGRDRLPLFQGTRLGHHYCENISHYRSPGDFEKIKKNLKNCELDYVYADISKFASSVNEKYDVIMLSNIYDYMEYRRRCFFDQIFALRHRLTDNGIMQVYYNFGSNTDIDTLFAIGLGKYSKDKNILKTYASPNSGIISFSLKKSRMNIGCRPNTTFVTKKYLDSRIPYFNKKQLEKIEDLLVGNSDETLVQYDEAMQDDELSM